MPTIPVALQDRSYDIVIDPGALETLGEVARNCAPHDQAMLVVDSKIADTHGETARSSLQRAGFRLAEATIEARETCKTLETARGLYDHMLLHKLERGSPVIALGGGVVGDIAGFVAATYLRGVPVIQVPTTLLAMVDASIGGKTGVNIPLPNSSTPGKNLIGSFWQPRAVVADPLTLHTLERRDLLCGLAECLKHALITDASLLDDISRSVEGIESCDGKVLTDLIARSAAIKVNIVQRDERESGERALLNLGHTFAHAIEPIETLDLRHGEAVAIGLCAASELSVRMGRMSQSDCVTVREAVAACSLPTRLPGPVPVAQLLEAMRYDKKVMAGNTRFILPCEIGRCEIVECVDVQTVAETWLTVGASG